MGGSSWSDSHYTDRAADRAKSGGPTFAYDAAAKAAAASTGERLKPHKSLDPKGVKIRESRDSEAHPESLAIAVFLDVTGSMAEVPKQMQKELCKLLGLIMRKNYAEHPQILIGAIGDANSDEVPLQVGQFESGIEIDDNLTNLVLERGGGGQTPAQESYELALYFMARHTAIDCFEKRGKKGYIFIIGDERPYPAVDESYGGYTSSGAKAQFVEEIIGDTLEAPIPTVAIVKELLERYNVYFINPNMTSHYKDTGMLRAWSDLIGQNVLTLDDPAGICDLIATQIGVTEDRIDIADVDKDLADAGTSASTRAAVSRALVKSGSGGGTGLKTSIPDSGADTGLATL